MRSMTVLILFTVSISNLSSINTSVCFSSVLFLLLVCITRFHGVWRCCLLAIYKWWNSYLFCLYSVSSPEDKSIVVSQTLQNQNCGTTSTGTGSYLHDDVFVEVLCMLPPKQMVGLKTVSKSWNILISDVCVPKITSSPLHGLFVRTLDSKGKHCMDFTCVDGAQTAERSSSFVQSCYSILPFTPTGDCFLDSTNGFLLFINRLSGIFYICNPTTQQCIALPKCPILSRPRGSAALVLDPQSTVVYVLRRPLRMVIYSSATGKWRTHMRLHLEDSILESTWTLRYVSLNGYIYCLSMSGHLLEFDVKRISARGIYLPKIARFDRSFGCIGLSKNRLHYAWNDGNKCRIRVWTFHENKWLKKPTFSITRFSSNPTSIFKVCCLAAPYAFHPSSDAIFLGHKIGIYCYHPDRDELEYVYGPKTGTSINGARVLTFPFSPNLDTYEDSTRDPTKNLQGREMHSSHKI